MGWGGDVHVLRTCAHILVHTSMLDAMHLLQIHASSANQDACVFLVNMLDATPLLGWSGWGGVGMFTFLEHAHIFLCTQACLMPCILCKARCLCLSCHTCLVLRQSRGDTTTVPTCGLGLALWRKKPLENKNQKWASQNIANTMKKMICVPPPCK